MNNRFTGVDPWLLVEEGFDPRRVRAAESLFAIGNGVLEAPISRSATRATRFRETTSAGSATPTRPAWKKVVHYCAVGQKEE